VKLSLLFRLVGAAVFVQVALGGLVTFNFIDAGVHIVWGIVLFVLALIAVAAVAMAKPRPRQLMGLAGAQAGLIVVQALLGFITLGSGSQVVAWFHFLVAMGIFGMALSGTFMAMRVERTGASPSPQMSSG